MIKFSGVQMKLEPASTSINQSYLTGEILQWNGHFRFCQLFGTRTMSSRNFLSLWYYTVLHNTILRRLFVFVWYKTVRCIYVDTTRSSSFHVTALITTNQWVREVIARPLTTSLDNAVVNQRSQNRAPQIVGAPECLLPNILDPLTGTVPLQ